MKAVMEVECGTLKQFFEQDLEVAARKCCWSKVETKRFDVFPGKQRYYYYCAKVKGSSEHARHMIQYFSITRYGEEDAKAICDLFVEKLNAFIDRYKLSET